MAWNEQVDTQDFRRDFGQDSGQTGGPLSGMHEAQPFAPQGGTMVSKEYVPGAAPVNPLIQQGMQQSQASVSQPAVALGAGMPAGTLAPASTLATAVQTDDETGADDVVWVNRAKRIIAGTRGDPHRQVQLLQQLSVVYLKERYGRSVHADEV